MRSFVDKEAFKKDLDEFVSYWDKEADEIKNREITEDDSKSIKLTYDKAKSSFCRELVLDSTLIDFTDHRKLRLIENKLDVSLAIAKSKVQSEHKTWRKWLDFFISPQSGNIAGYPITMPGIAWIGVPALSIVVLFLYVKNIM